MEFLFGISIDIDDDFFDLMFLFFGEFSLFEFILKNFSNDFVGPVALPSLDILNKNISELGNVSGMFEDNMRSDTSTVDFEHIFFKNKEFPPKLFNIVLDSTTNWPEVIKSSTTSVDIKSLEKDISSLDKIIKEFFVFGHFLPFRHSVPFCPRRPS